MRQQSLLYLIILASSIAAFTPPGLFRNVPPPLDHYRDLYRHRRQEQFTQNPMNPGPALPPDQKQDRLIGDDAVTISDVLPRTRSINIFAGLTRDISAITGRLESVDPSSNSTLLAPLNSAMQSLPRKPWEDREDDASGVSANRNEGKAAENLKKFVEEHLVPVSPWKEGQEGKIKTLGGQELWWEREGDMRVIMPGKVEVDAIVGKTANGEIWSLRSVVNYK